MAKTGGILLAGGRGTRLYPNTKIINKHLMPIYDKPMIYYSLSVFLLANIKDITLVCNPEDEEAYRKVLGDGEELGIEITYSTQDAPSGIPDAINVAATKLEINFVNNYLYFFISLYLLSNVKNRLYSMVRCLVF